MNRLVRPLGAAVVLLGVGLIAGGMIARFIGGTGVDNRPALVGMALAGVWVLTRVVTGRRLELPGRGGAGSAVGRALVLTLGLLLAVYPSRGEVVDGVRAIGDDKPTVDLREPQALEDALAALGDRAGHRRVTEVTINESAVWASAPVEPGEWQVRLRGYQQGEVTEAGRGNDAVQPSSAGQQFSMDEVAWDEILPAHERATAEYVAENGEEPAGTTEIHVRRTWGEDGARNGPVRIEFALVGDGRWRYSMEADGSGLARDQG
ncbi:hypothetical protein SAMN06297387_11293 [Streptomyces zhaozhouensis]|uniref:Uncharacterized protein n=1 Tax=Streptomyces zhaozhouensis TaxID=1300267 RepID=A0A286DYK3_9ACTN|nr:hypothetical protein [Streptomyces zhaozhouensis]SOD63736.1 hypothetical protein SAMN06297387_11293 [Streptomyces zhaozhouensis]